MSAVVAVGVGEVLVRDLQLYEAISQGAGGDVR